MSKKNRQQAKWFGPAPVLGKPGNNVTSPPTVSVQKPPTQNLEPTAALTQEHAEAIKYIPAEELPQVSAPANSPALSATELYQIAEQTRLARVRFEQKRQEYEQRLQELQKGASDLCNQKSEHDALQQQLIQKENELVHKEADLAQREMEARSGFAGAFRKELDKLCGEADQLEQLLAQLRCRIASEQTEWEKQREAERRKLQEERVQFHQEKERELEAERRELQTLCKRFLSERNQLLIEKETFDEEQKLLEKRVEQRSARRVEETRAVAEAYKEERDQARKDRDSMQERLLQFDKWQNRFGEKSPREIIEQLRRLEKEKTQLQGQLAERPGQDQLDQLRALETEQDQREEEKLLLRRENSELKSQLGRYRAHATEIESLRDQKEAFEAANKLLKTELEGLKKQIDALTRQGSDQNCFPACKSLDEKERNEPTSLWDRVEDLKVFAADLRHRIGSDPLTGKELYYEDRDIRAFLGGLAMSRLHLLQGISGTGKTSTKWF